MTAGKSLGRLGRRVSLTFSLLACTLAGRQTPAPRLFLWAWEKATDIRQVDPSRAGVAFLASSLLLAGDQVNVRPRMQPLVMRPDLARIVVVRLDVSAAEPPRWSEMQRAKAARAILDTAGPRWIAGRPGLEALQIDFDAPVSGRPFYAALLREVRAHLDAGVPLSITALASWCLGDPWIAGLPVDEAVPMLFRMGPDRRYITDLLARGKDFTLPACRDSVGLSVDEPIASRFPGRRIYLFNPRGWNAGSAARAIEEYAK